jgi:hypothetical protein
MISSIKECPVATSGPTVQPRLGAWLTMAVETGPGVATATSAAKKEKAKMAKKEVFGNI